MPCFWEKRTPPDAAICRVEIDTTPWDLNGTKKFRNVTVSEIIGEPLREMPKARTERIKAAGYTVIDDAYYLTSEVELAQRARRMAGVRETSDALEDNAAPVTVEAPAAPAAEPQAPEQAPSFVQRWGLKAGIILVALVLMIAVAKFFLLAGDSG